LPTDHTYFQSPNNSDNISHHYFSNNHTFHHNFDVADDLALHFRNYVQHTNYHPNNNGKVWET
jgi:hypothetical protein